MDFEPIKRFLGTNQAHASHAEKMLSGLGALIAIFLIYRISHALLGDAAMPIVASMGAAAVLLFAVPHGPLSQPWPLLGGNLISAAIGVTAAMLIDDTFIAAGAAVGTAVATMYYLKCLHPPGGATALAAVVSGQAVTGLGYGYLLTPVAINVAVILIVALAFNNLFRWRRYPAAWALKAEKPSPVTYSHEGLQHAFSQLDSFVDISEEEFLKVCELASTYDKDGKKKG